MSPYNFSIQDEMRLAEAKLGIDGWKAYQWSATDGGKDSIVKGCVPSGVYAKGPRGCEMSVTLSAGTAQRAEALCADNDGVELATIYTGSENVWVKCRNGLSGSFSQPESDWSTPSAEAE